MLNYVLDLVTDQILEKPYVEALFHTSVVDHQSYGDIPADLYDAYFEAILSVVRDCCADNWNGADEGVWTSQFTKLRRTIFIDRLGEQ